MTSDGKSRSHARLQFKSWPTASHFTSTFDAPEPAPLPGEVLVQVRASGLCSTDMHLLGGRQPLGELPRVPGHESAGDVVALGRGVEGAGWAGVSSSPSTSSAANAATA